MSYINLMIKALRLLTLEIYWFKLIPKLLSGTFGFRWSWNRNRMIYALWDAYQNEYVIIYDLFNILAAFIMHNGYNDPEMNKCTSLQI